MPERREPPEPLTPAPLAARLAALLLDWAVGLSLGLLSAALAWLWLLWQSGGGARQPSDAAIYLALLLGSLWLPVWAVWTVLSWIGDGRTPGLAAMALRICDRAGRPPTALSGLIRLLLLGIAGVSLALGPILVVGAVAAAVQRTLPLIGSLAAGALVLLAAADVLCCLLTSERRALHDLAAGTRVVRAS